MTADRRPSPRELDNVYRYLMENPRKRSLEALMILAFLFYAPHFWLAEQIWRRRRGR